MIAEAFGISAQSVAQWEADITAPTSDKLGRLDQLLHADGEIIAMYSEGDVVDMPAEISRLSERVEKLERATRALLQVCTQYLDLDLASLPGLEEIEQHSTPATGVRRPQPPA